MARAYGPLGPTIYRKEATGREREKEESQPSKNGITISILPGAARLAEETKLSFTRFFFLRLLSLSAFTPFPYIWTAERDLITPLVEFVSKHFDQDPSLASEPTSRSPSFNSGKRGKGRNERDSPNPILCKPFAKEEKVLYVRERI